MSEALNLYRLQKLDTRIDKTKSRLNEIEKTLSDDSRIKRAEKVFKIAKDNAKQIRINLHMIEDKVEAQRIKRKTDQASMFSGKIKNPKALQDLQMESEALKRYISQLEDEQLEVMIEYEEAEKKEKQAEKNLRQAKGTAIEENAALAGEKLKLEDELKTLLREKEAVLQSISPQSLNLYNRLRKSKRGIAVVDISEDSCGICGQALTPSDLQSIRSANTLVFCPSCGRILFEG